MIPLRDTIQSKSYPVVNTSIIVLNGLIFLVELGQGSKLNQFIFNYGLVPARLEVFAFLSFMFIHGGFWHLLGNMWSLYIFGDNVEDRLGSIRYLVFYLFCGWASGLTHLFTNWHSEIPTIGASGAIAGVMGAYLILYPRSRILTLIPIFFIPYFIEIPAFFFLGIWFFIQFLSAAGTHGQTGWHSLVGTHRGFCLWHYFLEALFENSTVRGERQGAGCHVKEEDASSAGHSNHGVNRRSPPLWADQHHPERGGAWHTQAGEYRSRLPEAAIPDKGSPRRKGWDRPASGWVGEKNRRWTKG